MSDTPPYPSAPEPELPTHSKQPPPPPTYGGGYGTPPPPPPGPPGGYGAPPTGPGGPLAYDVMAAVSYGWKAFTANVGPFLLLGILAVLIPGLISTAGSIFNSGGSALADNTSNGFRVGVGVGGGLVGFVLGVIAQIVSLFFTAASIRAALDVTEGQRVDIGAAFSRWSKGQVILLAIVVSIASSIGILLCVLPGLAVLFFSWYANYFVVGSGQSAIDAIGSSFRFTADNIGNLILLFLLAIVIAIAGICACGVGLLVAMPVVTVAAAYTFKVLQGQPVAAL